MQQLDYIQEYEYDEELNLNVKKILLTIWNRRILLIKVFLIVLLVFILMTYIMPKKYKVTSDLYINKSNNSNMMEVNPYVLDEASGTVVSMGADKAINNEIELMKSSLVLDKVIVDNNIVYRKGKKKGQYVDARRFYNKGKKLKIESVKNTNVISIQYTSNDPELAYGVVSSLIANYVELHKELNSEKSKADKQLIEAEYANAKEKLNEKLNKASGLPVQSITGIGNLTAMSAFSKSASQAMGTLRGQYLAGEKSQIAVTEESQKVANLASKLEWAKMVEQMSDSSKVLILNEPQELQPYEYASPKLIINIILGIIFGLISSIFALIISEQTDKFLSYSKLGDNIVYNIEKDFNEINVYLLANADKNITFVMFADVSPKIVEQLRAYSNIGFVKADTSSSFVSQIKNSDNVICVAQINKTDSNLYKYVKKILESMNISIVIEALV